MYGGEKRDVQCMYVRVGQLYQRSVSKSMTACNCHNKDDIVGARQLTGKMCSGSRLYIWQLQRTARQCIIVGCHIVSTCGMYQECLFMIHILQTCTVTSPE